MSRPSPGLSERDAWIAFASTSGVGIHIFGRLLETFGSAREAVTALQDLPERNADRRIASMLEIRLRPGLAVSIRGALADPGRTQREMDRLLGWTLTPLDADYPAALHELEEPPLVVYGLGERDALHRGRAIAVVGTRRPTPAARDLAHRVAQRLSEVGATVISGLAIGIDGAVHRAVVEAGGETVAVVGGGLEAPGPAAHRSLAGAIREHGAIISELAPGVPPTRGTFPRRNRIISALSTATIVVEAPARSGALITARHALEQGRQLMVAPGRPLDRRIAGNLALLRESPAIPLVGLDEMVVDLGLDARPEATTERDDRPVRLTLHAALSVLGEHERLVARSLSSGPQTMDRLCQVTRLEPGVVAATLTILQMRGWVRPLGSTLIPAGPLITATDR